MDRANLLLRNQCHSELLLKGDKISQEFSPHRHLDCRAQPAIRALEPVGRVSAFCNNFVSEGMKLRQMLHTRSLHDVLHRPISPDKGARPATEAQVLVAIQ